MATKKWIQENQDKMKQYRREYYYRNREKEIARSKRIKKEHRKIIRDYVLDIKSKSQCKMCGYKEHPAALQFHHRLKNKEFELANAKDYSLDRVKKEIEKCEILCANCHSILHSNTVVV